MAMTATAPGSAIVPASLDVPLTQQTAPVLEFRCLYTSDIRKKVKKWQDGRLKYHTFNKKIMVWDERSHFIGETYWRDDSEFGDGEELRLERNGTLVEVGECIGKSETDLSDLVGKRVKERENRAAAKITTGTPRKFPPTFTGNHETPNEAAHLRPKSLNAVLTPTGHYGRALMPNTSPFEDRQRLLNGVSQPTENERPAKRRKQESPPSKSGYAQNLMGTKITLTSSRPPSTATIQYEPVRVRPIQKAPATTIDLTLDEDGGDSQTMNKGRRDEINGGDQATKVQKRRHPSPKSKSGYASNLTGAALTLSRPTDFSQRRTHQALKVNRNPMVEKRTVPNPFTSSDIENDSSDAELPKEPLMKAITKTKRSTDRNLQRQPERDPLAQSSASELEVAASLSKHGQSLQKSSVPKSSIIDPVQDRPTSALRIKSRPPRKMLMLLDRPSSHSSGPNESSIPKRPVARPPDLYSEKPILSQATVQLNAFCMKQEAAVKARLDRRRPQLMPGELSSSPTDGGIDHQTIDRLLTRKSIVQNRDSSRAVTRKPTERLLDSTKATGNSQQIDSDTNFSTQEKSGAVGSRIEPTRPPTLLVLENCATISSSCSPDSQRTRRSVPSLETSPSDIFQKLKYEVTEVAPKWENNKNSEPDSVSADKSHRGRSLGATVSACTRAGATISHNVESTQLAQMAVNTSYPTHLSPPRNVTTINGFMPKNSNAENLGSVIQSATDHFRAMIKPSDSSFIEIEKLAPVPPYQSDESENPWCRTSASSNNESVSKDGAVKSSPTPIAARAVISNGPLSELAVAQVKTSESRDAEIVQLSNLKSPQVRLANPATRGKSLQSVAANTVEALNPTNAMAPPQPRIRSRGERPPVIEDLVNKAAVTTVRKDTPGGPWSRESFDLFGNWKPPAQIGTTPH